MTNIDTKDARIINDYIKKLYEETSVNAPEGSEAGSGTEPLKIDVLAQRSGVPVQIIISMFRNQIVPAYSDIEALAACFGMTADQLISDAKTEAGQEVDTNAQPVPPVPSEDLSYCARLWSGVVGVILTPSDVALMLIMYAASRIAGGDHSVEAVTDVCYYAELAAMAGREVIKKE